MDMRKDLGGAGFGRRRSALMGVSTAEANASSVRPTYDLDTAGFLSRLPPLRLAGYMFGGLLAVLCIEAMFSSTSLITPISQTFLNTMRVIGFALGVPLALLTIRKPHRPMGLFKKLLTLLFLPIMTGFVGGQAAWRISDWVEFGFSSARFEPATYPIKYATHGRTGRRDSFEIDPFNVRETINIAVPSAQFDAIWPNHSDYCMTVMQRRSASGAIEIRNDGVFMLQEPAPAVLTPCNATGTDTGGETSPWDKKD